MVDDDFRKNNDYASLATIARGRQLCVPFVGADDGD
jgi:hypothetical protein